MSRRPKPPTLDVYYLFNPKASEGSDDYDPDDEQRVYVVEGLPEGKLAEAEAIAARTSLEVGDYAYVQRVTWEVNHLGLDDVEAEDIIATYSGGQRFL